MRRFVTVTLPIFSVLGLFTFAYADCPSGVRQLSESEQQAYLSMAQAIRSALPAAPVGWTLKDPTAKMPPTVPKDACGNSDPVPGWYGQYFWDEEEKRYIARNRERDVKLRKASAWTPVEEKELHGYELQSRDLRYKARGAMKTNPAEAARLEAEAKPFAEKIDAVRKAHAERVAPEVAAVNKEYDAVRINTIVNVHIGTWEDGLYNHDVKESLQIQGGSTAFVNSQNELVLIFSQKLPSFKESGGIGTRPRTVTAIVKGDRPPAETIAKLLGASGLSNVGKK